jgi:uncharacterized protein YuzE
MRIKVDKETDTLYFRLDESRIMESEEIQPGVILDYDENNRVIGIELLNISSRTSQEELNSIHFQAA